MQTPPDKIQSYFSLYCTLAVLWLIIVGALLTASYSNEEADAYERLAYKTEVSFVQFERHWPAVKALSPQEISEYLASFTEHFSPSIHFSVINKNGKLMGATLTTLTQLSYSPVLRQFDHRFSYGMSCTPDLTAYVMAPINACSYRTQDGYYLIASLSADSIFNYWVNKSQLLFIGISAGIIFFSLLFYFLNKKHKANLSRETTLADEFQKQGHDFKRIISNLPGMIYRLSSHDKKINFISSGSLQLLGYPPQHFIEQQVSPFSLIVAEDKTEFERKSTMAYTALKSFEFVYRINTLNGEQKWILDRGRCYQNEASQYCVEGVLLDITERELVRQQIEYLAIQDPLTELYNRYRFNDELVNAVDDANRKQEHFAMLFIDLDRFKNINDSLGHQLGDRLLRKVASRLNSMVSEPHFLARMGGDEFVVLMRHITSQEEVEAMATEINFAMRKPFNIDAYQLRTSCSIGISLCPEDSQHSHILWRYSDTAMYQVKNRGGDGYQFFTNAMGDLVQHRISIEHGLIPGLENKQFELYYQPQVSLETGEVIGAEALIRWNHPELGMISPAEFIPIAEETGFIHDLGDWIIQDSLKQLQRWQQVKPDMNIAINVSALQITQEFPAKLKDAMKYYHIHKNTLELEITESLLMENIDFVQPLLTKVREQNVQFAIDDFGTGYSSLSYLRYLPINKLKIDRAFVMNLETNTEDVAMVKAIISMAKNLNLKVLAEGIETLPQLEILKQQGCDSFQGYLFSKPIPADDFFNRYILQKTHVQLSQNS